METRQLHVFSWRPDLEFKDRKFLVLETRKSCPHTEARESCPHLEARESCPHLEAKES